MKKTLALLFCMIFVLGLAVSAYAEVTLSGDARVRGIFKKDDKDGNAVGGAGGAVKGADDDRFYDQRFRFTFKGENDFGAGAVYSVTATENGAWNDNNVDTIGDDWALDDENVAYLYAPLGEMTLSAGRMPSDWGLKFLKGDTHSNGIKLSGKMGENSWAVYTVKKNETRNRLVDGANLADKDIIGGVFKASMGEFKVGVLVDYTMDNRPKSTSKDCTAAVLAGVDGISGTADDVVGTYGDCGAEDSGTTIDVTFSGAAGPASIMGEVVMKNGKVNESSKGDNPMGAVVAAAMNFDAVSASLAYAMTKNEYVADNHFMPTQLFGTAGAIGALDFGQNGDTTALVASASMKISDAMTVGAKLALAKLKKYSASQNDTDITEIDGTFAYAIGENTSYNLAVAMGTVAVDSPGSKDTKLTYMYHEISVKF